MNAIARNLTPEDALRRFSEALAASGYKGEIETDIATRTVFATDNSVYELVPRAVLFPREPDDLNRVMRASHLAALPIVARGGGTGTNGQSLTDSIIVDCSRYLTRIETIDPEAGIAVVQPGVILDELNRAASTHGLFFAPTVSTASRATLGGMAATDASGKGSRVYGRTSDHILSMDVVLPDGSDWRAEPLEPAEFDAVTQRDDLPGHIHRTLGEVLKTEADEIDRVFPVMNRGLTGYNLKELHDEAGRFRLSKLLGGSEGTLALTKRLTLRLLRKKPFRALMVVAYDDALAALGDVERLTAADPTAIEFIDDKIAELAQEDPVWGDIEAIIAQDGPRRVRGLNVVEVQADTSQELDGSLGKLEALCAGGPGSVVSQRMVRDPQVIAQIWSLRSKCVGLLGRMDPVRQGTPFVEDAAVPPQNLAAFVEGFRKILDAHGLSYGMFGHADVGCVHVRPALDMRRLGDAAMIRKVSDAVATLAQEHGGLIWGEHGKGFRGEYGPQIFGPRLYAAVCRIKKAFDPGNLMNPGKIATPDPSHRLAAIDQVPFRGTRDAAIAPALGEGYEHAVKCNGNGQCFNRDVDDAMCPSYKATGDRTKSPKGRAALIREWLRLQSDQAAGGAKADIAQAVLPDLETRLHESLTACLGCKACASQCPVKVDIPAMRSLFFASYYARNRRPLRHYLLAALEPISPLLHLAPPIANLGLRLVAPALAALGLVDLPAIRPPARRRIKARAAIPPAPKTVILVEDSFLGTFDGSVIDACRILLEGLGYQVLSTRPLANGKAAQVLGMKTMFEKTARRTVAELTALADAGHTLVGIEPAVLAMQNGEYQALGTGGPQVLSIDRFLEAEIAAGRIARRPETTDSEPLSLFAHCTEKTADPRVAARWQAIFAHFGVALQPQATGCCGMAGSFGHERDNLDMSKKLFDLSWRDRIEKAGEGALATGFSCRCQAKRFSGIRPKHPVEYLAGL
jgi:FAD/FMN-containing dehydrogenase/Fe-S oxidoreductase